MSETPIQQLFTLQRYYLSASLMRRKFYEFVSTHPGFKGASDDEFPDYFTLMSLWYATLWVVLDGWPQMGLHSAEVERVRADETFAKLKDFRDATMHYRPGYIDAKHRRLIADPESVRWVNDAHEAIGHAILVGLGAVPD